MRRVAVLIETSRAYGRGLLRGVARYNREHGHWSVYIQPHGLDDPPPPWLKRWRGDGILVRIGDRRMLRAVLGPGLPTVDLRGVVPDLGVPFIGVDNRAVADMAADHLIERGLRHFGFCGLPAGAHPHMDERRNYFVGADQGDGAQGPPLRGRHRPGDVVGPRAEAAGRLDRPAPQAGRDHGVPRRPRVAGRSTPARPPGSTCPTRWPSSASTTTSCSAACSRRSSSSIDVNPERIGYQAAELLDRMMAGEPPRRDPVFVAPRAVALRQSTDTLAVDDPEIASALRHIRDHACQGLRVGDVLDQVPLSRSVLERRFRAIVGRTPKAEIARVQLERAKQLLSESHLAIDVVAARSGFRDARYLCDVFAKKVGVTPGAYREQTRRAARLH